MQEKALGMSVAETLTSMSNPRMRAAVKERIVKIGDVAENHLSEKARPQLEKPLSVRDSVLIEIACLPHNWAFDVDHITLNSNSLRGR